MSFSYRISVKKKLLRMLPRRKFAKLIISTLLGFCVLALVLVFTPSSAEGVYNAGETFKCMCDCNHYIRVKNGVVTVYSPGHDDASVIGPYEVGSDGRVKVYFSSFDYKSPDKHLFTIEESYLGRSEIIFADSDDQFRLIRALPFGEANNAINKLEVKAVLMEEDQIVTVFYDKNHNELRRENKSIPNKK